MTTEFDQGDDSTLEELHNYWVRHYDVVRDARRDIPEMDLAESLLTVAVAKMCALSNSETVAARLAAIAGGVHATMQHKHRPPPGTTMN